MDAALFHGHQCSEPRGIEMEDRHGYSDNNSHRDGPATAVLPETRFGVGLFEDSGSALRVEFRELLKKIVLLCHTLYPNAQMGRRRSLLPLSIGCYFTISCSGTSTPISLKYFTELPDAAEWSFLSRSSRERCRRSPCARSQDPVEVVRRLGEHVDSFHPAWRL